MDVLTTIYPTPGWVLLAGFVVILLFGMWLGCNASKKDSDENEREDLESADKKTMDI